MIQNHQKNSLENPSDKFKDECGVVGIYNDKDACLKAILALYSLQHRGQESCGVITSDNGTIHVRKDHGIVGEVFALGDSADKKLLPGNIAVGHVRYSTAGGGGVENIQPLTIKTSIGDISIAHNGNLTNNVKIHNELLDKGYAFQSTSDTGVILQLIASKGNKNFVDRIKESLVEIQGAYSLVFMLEDKLIGVRDSNGIRPLVLGQFEDGGYILASETCALDLVGANFVRDIEAGELVIIDEDGVKSHIFANKQPRRFCIFEFIYFMRPNSCFNGHSVSEVREQIGRELAKEASVDADVVVPIPDSGIHAAIGFAEEAGIPYKQGILRSHFVGRTFISPTQMGREFKTKLKLTVNKSVVKGKRVVLVDDSIVRGTTIPRLVDMVKKAGANEVHVRISSPPITHPCFYGIDTPLRKDLRAAYDSVYEICESIGANSLAYVTVKGMYRAVGVPEAELIKENREKRKYCDACFTGDYSIPLVDREEKRKREGTDEFE
ncbi:MAG: amidophosphoribosyltransferase [Alphaproteobacteria bacterium]|nr:amidophosphoribosyltransferase [Alphaproteobacteria bacterium]